MLEFTKEKNGVHGELVGLGRSGHHFLCPVLAMIARVKHLRIHNAPPTTPINSVYTHVSWQAIQTTILTQHLRQAVLAFPDNVGITPADISIQSLHASGAMALLCTEADTDKIRLLGRWHPARTGLPCRCPISSPNGPPWLLHPDSK